MLKQSILATTAILGVMTVTAGVAQDAPTRDTVVATVDGTEITLGQMIISASQLPPEYQQLPPDVLFQGVMDQLIQQQVLADTLENVPAKVDISLMNDRRSMLAGIVVNGIADTALSEEAVQAAYDAAFANVEPGLEYNAAHILVATEDEAKAVVDRLTAGEDFAAVAQELSLDTGSGAAGGELGWFGLGMMVPEFETAVVALGEGEMGAISAPVQTDFGWHVIKLTETRPTTPPALEDVRGDLETQLRQQAVEAHLTELMAQSEITRTETGTIDPTVISNLDLLED
jgi:peptidyl-prolyl cis-trans isomerase C